MKNNYLIRSLRTSILRIACLVALFANLCFFSAYAQTGIRLFSDNFEYEEGDIVGKGSWIRDGFAGSANTLNVVDAALTHPTYQPQAIGKALGTRIISGQKISTPFPTQSSGSIYYSALIRVDSIKNASATADFFMYFTNGDENASVNCGVLYTKSVAGNAKFQLSASAAKNAPVAYPRTETFDFKETILVVMKYEFVEGANNDKVTLWVNPDISGSEPGEFFVQSQCTDKELSQVSAFLIRQSTSLPIAIIDAVRVATSWEALFGAAENTDPTITVKPADQLNFGIGFSDYTYTKGISLKGTNLTADISASLHSGTHISINKNTITKEMAMSAEGDSLYITLAANHPVLASDTLILSSTGAKTIKLPIGWMAGELKDVANLSALKQEIISNPNGFSSVNYRITGDVLVSYVQPKANESSHLQIYVQDADKGLSINDEYDMISSSYQSGDKLKNLVGNLSRTFGSISFTPIRDLGETISSGNTVTALEISLADIKETPANYESRLLKFKNIEFPNRATTNDGIFAAGNSLKMAQGNIAISEDYSLRVLNGMDFIGETIPAKADIIGISTAGSGKLIAPRSKADIKAISTPDPDPEPEPNPDPEADTLKTKNLLLNPSVEEWASSSPLFGDKPIDWSVQGISAKETSIVKKGTYALKITEATQNYNKIEQEIESSAHKFNEGEKYELRFSYYVITSKSGNDVKISSTWLNVGTPMVADGDKLNNNTYFTSVGKWETKVVQTTVPKFANSFLFNVGVAKGVIAIFDDFSFKLIPDTLPKIYLNPENIATINAKVDSSVNSAPIQIQAVNLKENISISITGDNASYFTASKTSITPSDGSVNENISITYKPTAAGRHFADLEVKSGTITKRIEIIGQATIPTPEGKPVISISKDMLDQFTAEVGKDMIESIVVNANDLEDYLYISVEGDQKEHFLSSTSMMGKIVVDGVFKVTYRPKSEGSHIAYIKFKSKNADTITLTVKGVGLAPGKDTTQTDINHKIVLDIRNPKSLWIENFSKVEHNKQIADSIMQNVVLNWNRPWWGFHEKDASGNVVGQYAKATGYVYQQERVDKCEMWVISPALDFKNSASKMFTFRVMGDFMFENHQTKLELFYLEKEGDSSYQNKVELAMPSTPDENGDWREIHLDLTGQNIADVFFMGFRFSGLTGSENSVVYYLDDLSFGRTDLATISCASKKIVLNTEVFTGVASEAIIVDGKNLKEEISISILGPNASKFDASKSSIPKIGGDFKIIFSPLEQGLHLAYVKLSSPGAADILIPIEGRSVVAIPKILIAEKDLNVHLRLGSGTEITSDEIIVNPFLLTANISLALEGTNADQFHISKTVISKDGVGEKFTITYKPTTKEQKHMAKVRLRSTGATDVVINVTAEQGTAIEENAENAIRIVRTENGFLIDNRNVELKEINVYNISGQKIYHGKSVNSQVEIPIKNRGCYFIKIVSGRQVRTTKLIW